MVAYVGQEDGHGCGVACLAMVTGRTYAEVKAWDGFVGKNFRSEGLDQFDLLQYLGDTGFAAAFRWRALPGSRDRQRNVRSPWPNRPFAPAHVVAVDYGRHLVVLLRDGTVLDPASPAPRTFESLHEPTFMIGVFRQNAETTS